ncbi:MAG: hypothetical protein AVDCRST_MAG56-974, partial [uncultured Cytophagales bacterium]
GVHLSVFNRQFAPGPTAKRIARGRNIPVYLSRQMDGAPGRPLVRDRGAHLFHPDGTGFEGALPVHPGGYTHHVRDLGGQQVHPGAGAAPVSLGREHRQAPGVRDSGHLRVFVADAHHRHPHLRLAGVVGVHHGGGGAAKHHRLVPAGAGVHRLLRGSVPVCQVEAVAARTGEAAPGKPDRQGGRAHQAARPALPVQQLERAQRGGVQRPGAGRPVHHQAGAGVPVRAGAQPRKAGAAGQGDCRGGGVLLPAQRPVLQQGDPRRAARRHVYVRAAHVGAVAGGKRREAQPHFRPRAPGAAGVHHGRHAVGGKQPEPQRSQGEFDGHRAQKPGSPLLLRNGQIHRDRTRPRRVPRGPPPPGGNV